MTVVNKGNCFSKLLLPLNALRPTRWLSPSTTTSTSASKESKSEMSPMIKMASNQEEAPMTPASLTAAAVRVGQLDITDDLIMTNGNVNQDNHQLIGTINTVPSSPTSLLTAAVESESSLLAMVRHLLPELSSDRHKGDAGRIGVLGGCRDYTGAPYFAAISALKVGCDLSHVFCTSEAAPVIKSYSPELIVHPVLDNRNAVDEITQWLPRLHALIIGPGLGRDDKMYYHVKDVIQAAHKLDIPIVIDADGLFFVTQYPEVIKGSKKVILTPNAVEFARLYKKLIGTEVPTDENDIVSVTRVGELLGNVTIVRKGERDIIADGSKYLLCDHRGSPRRCGGQGDLLSGSLGVFAYWSSTAAAIAAVTDTATTSLFDGHDHASSHSSVLLGEYGSSMCAAYAACWLTRECSRLAFAEFRRSMTTSDMITKIGKVIQCLEEDDMDDFSLMI